MLLKSGNQFVGVCTVEMSLSNRHSTQKLLPALYSWQSFLLIYLINLFSFCFRFFFLLSTYLLGLLLWTEANPSRAMNSTASNDDDMLENEKF